MIQSTHVAIAAGSPDTVRAGIMIAERGGNVVDIAVASAITAAHTEVLMCSLGGSAFINIRLPDRDAEVIEGGDAMPRSAAGMKPEDASWNRVEIAYGDGITVNVGHGSIAVPGMLRALETAWQRYGSLSWQEIMVPAIHFAKQGTATIMPIDYWLGLAGEAVFATQKESRESFFPNGRALRTGDVFTLPNYLNTLELISAEGARAFYEGDISEIFEKDLRDNGGYVTRRDLEEYTAVVRKPMLLESAGYTMALMPPPSIGGAMLGSMIRLYEAECANLASEAEKVELKSRVQRMMFSLRHTESMGGLSEDIADRVLNLEWLKTYLHKVFSPNTNHLSFATGDGAVVSITMSNGYGAGVSLPVTGIACNNSLGEPELNPQGYFQIPPSGRFVSNMCPITAWNSKGTTVAMGSPGASRITTTLLQGWINYAMEGMDARSTTEAPRFHVENIDGVFTLQHEPGIDTSLATELFRSRAFEEKDMYFGALNIAGRDEKGDLFASADIRREGAGYTS